MPDTKDQQPFIGAAIGAAVAKGVGGALEKAIGNIIQKKTEEVIARGVHPEDVPVVVAKEATPVVVGQLQTDPVVAKATNNEPWYKSKATWLGISGTLSSVGGLISLAAARSTDVNAYLALLATLITSVGAIIRNRTFNPTI